MRIYAISDIHGHFSAALKHRKKIIKLHPDIVIILGDIVHFGTMEQVSAILKYFSFEDIPTFFIPGNCDPRELLNVDEIKKVKNLHRKYTRIEQYTFVGFGGSNITPFNTLIEFDENTILEELDQLLSALDKRSNIILATHAPPFNTKVDLTFMHQHVGSKAVRQIIEKYEPILSLHGHIHEAQGYDYLKNTLLLNPGPASRGFYTIIEIENTNIDFKIERE
ncbi:MAG: metallophosphoesterase family protein [Candidatus Asgardarchaeia archaeon]